MLTTKSPAHELFAAAPSAAVLKRSHISYYCEGSTHGAARSTRAGISIQSILDPLSYKQAHRLAAERDWLHEPLGALGRYLVSRHHRFEQQLCVRIQRQLNLVTAYYSDKHAFFRRVATQFSAFATLLYDHLHREETLGFAAIARWDAVRAAAEPDRRVAAHRVRVQLGRLAEDHRRLCAMFRQLEADNNLFIASASAPIEITTLYAMLDDLARDLRTHIRLESDILFRRVSESLAAEAPSFGIAVARARHTPRGPQPS